MTSPNPSVDIAIVGGGMVGASFALALVQAVENGLTVAVVESANVNTQTLAAGAYQPSFDGRVTALSYGSRLIFEELGVWPMLEAHAGVIKKIHVSEKNHFGTVQMDAREAHVDALGYVVENAWIGHVLLAKLKNHPGIQWISPAQVENIQMSELGAHLTLSGSQVFTLDARLVVIADGGRSSLCEHLGITQQRHAYAQRAIIAVVDCEKEHHGVAYERFTANGPMALLPLAARKMGVVWTVPEENASVALQLSDADFLRAIHHQFGYRLGAFTAVTPRLNYPLQLIRRDEQVRRGLVVLGNAAHTLHPVAGQGFNLALRDAAHLAACVIDAYAQQQSIADIALLKTYQTMQQEDQDKTISFSHLTTTLFSSSRLSSLLVRRAGFMALQMLPFAKSWLMQQAMGVGGQRANLMWPQKHE